MQAKPSGIYYEHKEAESPEAKSVKEKEMVNLKQGKNHNKYKNVD